MSVRDELLRAADRLAEDGCLTHDETTPAVWAVLQPVLDYVEPYRGVVELRRVAKDSYRGGILAWLD